MFKKALIICLLLVPFFTGCSSEKLSDNTNNSSSEPSAVSDSAQPSANNQTSPSASNSSTSQVKINKPVAVDQFSKPQKGETIAIMNTSMGDIKIKFFYDVAPKAVENFVKHAQDGYYNGLTFHRVINNFMIQGGDPLGNGSGGESIWNKPFEDEISNKLHNFRGALSMANSGPNTNGSQFFIVQLPKIDENSLQTMKQSGFSQELIDKYTKVGGAPWLDNNYTIFGQAYEGMDVVDKIAAVDVDQNSKPLSPVTINSIKITNQE